MTGMLIKEKLGNIDSVPIGNRIIDWLSMEWYETNKRILRKTTQAGKEISLRFLQENAALTQGDVLYEDDQTLIVVDLLPCDCLVVKPLNMLEMASLCYEIGNKHLPLFIENDILLVPFEQPLYNLLHAQGYAIKQETRKLLRQLKTTVSPHGRGNESLFNRIMKLTTTNGQ
jgi:urease accessory protein